MSVSVWLVAFVHRDELVSACHINLAALNPVVALKGNSNVRTRIATVTDVMDNIMIAAAARIFSSLRADAIAAASAGTHFNLDVVGVVVVGAKVDPYFAGLARAE